MWVTDDAKAAVGDEVKRSGRDKSAGYKGTRYIDLDVVTG